jgi:hypothetical protein
MFQIECYLSKVSILLKYILTREDLLMSWALHSQYLDREIFVLVVVSLVNEGS